jgi:DNA-binding transcriptional regulator YiaG
MTSLERSKAQMKGLRCSYPPYYVAAMTPDGWPVGVLPGDSYEILERGLAPTAHESRMTLIRLRRKLRWSRAGMAAFMGISRAVVRRWETGERKPSGAARRLIWLLNLLAHEPDKLKTAFDLIVWGKGPALAECASGLQQLWDTNNTRLSVLTWFPGLLMSVRDTQRSCRIGWQAGPVSG